jgi:hypothetical protein
LKKSEWSDKQLEELLQHLPEVKDRQDPDELFRKISSRIENEQVHQSNKKTWLLPSVAAVAAVFLFLLIGPTFMNLSGGSNESANEESAVGTESMDQATKQENSSRVQDNNSLTIAGTEESTTLEMAAPVIDNILRTKTDGDTLITIGVPEAIGQNIVPISMLSAEPGKSQLELLEKALSTMSTEEYGLDPSPLKGLTFKEAEGEQAVIITFPTDFVVNGSTNELSYYVGIQETFRWMGFTEAILRKEDGGQVELGGFGPVDIPLSTTMNKGYYVYKSETGQTYLVPSPKQDTTFLEALNSMKIAQFNLEASIPTNVTIENVNELDKDSVTITFSNDYLVNQDEISHQLMIKAILLTAREFGFIDVTFVNTPEQVGDIQLMKNGEPKPVDVPTAPNYINFPTSK